MLVMAYLNHPARCPSAACPGACFQARVPPTLLQAGEEFVKEHPGLGLEHANSYIEGLSTTPFPDPHSGAYKWLQAVEPQASGFCVDGCVRGRLGGEV